MAQREDHEGCGWEGAWQTGGFEVVIPVYVAAGKVNHTLRGEAKEVKGIQKLHCFAHGGHGKVSKYCLLYGDDDGMMMMMM